MSYEIKSIYGKTLYVAKARGDLAERLEAAAKATVGRHSDLLREAASTLDHQTKALEAADELRSAALDLLDSLGEPHYHDLIGTTYTLHKEQADKLRTATRTTKGGRDDG